ncbi:MAG: hypothetical protein KGI05_06715 [Thaumarchaeota archaeon]|nr:hypothetical protein [Nitrososphaerota archaeon]
MHTPCADTEGKEGRMIEENNIAITISKRPAVFKITILHLSSFKKLA